MGLYRLQATCHKRMYNMNAAITALTKANGISMKSGQADPALLSELAECHVGTGNYEKASGIYFILTSTLPQNMYYRISQAMMMYMMKEYDNAADVCRTILAKDSTSVAALNILAGSCMGLGDAESAEKHYRKLYACNPSDASTLIKLCRCMMNTGNSKDVIALTGRYLVNYDPEDTEIWKLYATGLYLIESYDESVKEFESILSAGASSYDVHYYLDLNYQKLSRPAAALEHFEKASGIDSSDVSLYYRMASALAETGNIRRSDQMLDKAYSLIQPDSTAMHNIFLAKVKNKVQTCPGSSCRIPAIFREILIRIFQLLHGSLPRQARA